MSVSVDASWVCRPPGVSSWLRRPCLAALLLALSFALTACPSSRRVSEAPGAGQVTPPPGAAQPQIEAALPVAPAVPTGPVPQVGTRIGLLLPLSGPNAELGKHLRQAAELALFESGNDDLGLVVRDSEQTAGGPAPAAQQLLAGGVRLILGPVFSPSVAAAAPAARAAGVNLISFSTDRSVAGSGVFVMGILPGLQVERVVGYAGRQGIRRFAALLPGTPYGQTVASALNGAVSRFGGTVVQTAYYDPGASDLSPTVRQLAAYAKPTGAGFQAILLPEGGLRLQTIAPLLPFYDVDPAQVRFLGTMGWYEPGTGREPALVGGWFAAPAPEPWEAFAARYQAVYGEAPPRLASVAYDAATLAAALARTGDFSLAALTRPSGFLGTDGIFRFLPDGSVERGLAVFEVERDGFRVIEPAPRTFDELIY